MKQKCGALRVFLFILVEPLHASSIHYEMLEDAATRSMMMHRARRGSPGSRNDPVGRACRLLASILKSGTIQSERCVPIVGCEAAEIRLFGRIAIRRNGRETAEQTGYEIVYVKCSYN